MSIRERLRDVSLTTVLLHGIPAPRGGYPPAKPLPETAEYVDARTEARTLCRNLGLDVDNTHWDTAEVGDFLRLAYAEGWKACESRINSPDMADALAVAVTQPSKVVERSAAHQGMAAHIVQAVQRVVVHGLPKDKRPAAEPAHDPTHGRIDPDIQQAVDGMKPSSVGQRVAMENTLQDRRDGTLGRVR